MYLDLTVWLRLLRHVHREAQGPWHWLRRMGWFALGSLYLLLSNLFLLADHLLFTKFRRLRIHNGPVFVIGNMRSGTTRMHRLLCDDKRHTTSLALWEILFPSLIQRRVILGVAWLDRVALRGFFARRLVATQDARFGKARRMHNWDVLAPEEDEWVFFHCLRSASLTIFFPDLAEFLDLSWADAQPERTRRRMMEFYDGIIRRQLALHGEDRRYIVKSPTFVQKMRTLVAHYPEAKFIYLVRNPHEMMHSGISLVFKTWRALGTRPAMLESSTRVLGETTLRVYEYAEEVMATLRPDQVQVVEYDELLAQPRQVMERLYQTFGWKLDAAYAGHLAAEEQRAKGYRSEHRYSRTELSPPDAEIERRLGFLFDRYGWQRHAGESAS
jgi:hypothetical protein